MRIRWKARVCATLLCALTTSGAQAQWLMAPPVHYAEQDASKSLATKGAGLSLTRAEVSGLYHSMYLATDGVEPEWNGDVPGCAEDRTSPSYIAATLARINFYRLLAGLPANISEDTGDAATDTQKAALIMSANGQLSHTPPDNWQCLSSEGKRAAGRSNLALGVAGLRAVDLYMDDFGTFNAAVGHRRWILYPPQTTMASGAIPRGSQWSSNALWVIGNFGARPATPEGVAWPAAGYMPYDLLPSGSNRWSFSFPGADFSDAQVTMSVAGVAFPVTLEPLYNGYGDNTLVWLPRRSQSDVAGVSYSRPGSDTTYRVVVDDVRIGGQYRRFEYDVVVFEADEGIFDSGFE